jgi:hypothetical protein
MTSQQITTVLFFELEGFENKRWAFSQVVYSPERLKDVPGIEFFKSLGTGGGNGFGLIPSFSKYTWLIVWKSKDFATDFFSTNRYLKEYQTRCKSHQVLYLENIISNGLWSKKNPFRKSENQNPSSKILVLTRATIKLNKLIQFWFRVGSTAKSLYNSPGILFASGVGEVPLIHQATLTIWDNEESMKSFAYQNPVHRKIISLTRHYNWYKEELFARFNIVEEIEN